MSAKRASSALLSRIGEAAMKEFGQDDLYIAQAPPGLGLGSAHLHVLAEPEEHRLDQPASVARLVEIARVVDCVQRRADSLSTADQSPGYLSEVFPKLMKNVRFFSAPLSEEERARYNQAQAVCFKEAPFVKTPEYEEFCLIRADVEKKEVSREEMRRNLGSVNDPAQRDALQHDLDALEKLCAEKQDALDALDKAHGFRTAEQVIAAAERRMDETPPSIRTALDTMSIFQITDPASNVTHVACNFFPSQLDEGSWIPVTLTREDVAHGHDEGEHGAADADEINDDDIDLITVEVQALRCDRPWFWPPLFENRRWDWETPSDPVASDRGGLIPGYIHALICGRNLAIKTRLGAPPKLKPAMAVPPGSSFLIRALMSAQAPHRLGVATAASFAPGPVIPSAPGPIVPGPGLHAGVIVRDHRMPPQLALRGRLVDEAGRPISQAAVTLEGIAGRSAVSGPDGAFAFPGVRPGPYRVQAQKPGFMMTTAPATAPQVSPVTIRMKALPLPRAMVRLQSDDGKPFTGAAKVVIQTAAGQRVESMDGLSQAAFSLPAGSATFSLASVEADRISPPAATIMLAPGQPQPAVTFTISRAFVLRNPDIQLLAFVCRKVPPPCPSPDPALRR